MKKKVYVFDDYVSSQKNGIGSFLGEFLDCMKQIDVDLCVLVFNANVEEFTITKEGEVEKMLFPPLLIGEFVHNADIIDKFFRLYIPDASWNVFFINHSPCGQLLRVIKSSHPLSRLVFTIHDLGWTSLCWGDVDKFKRAVLQEKQVDGNESSKYIEESYTEEKEIYKLADRVVCLNRDTYNLLLDTYFVCPEKIVLIPNGLRQQKNASQASGRSELRKKLFVSEEDKILIFAGRPTPKKGMYALLEAFERVLQVERNARLVIAGFDNGVNMEGLITIASPFAARVLFTGLIDRARLTEWYSVADVGIIPSFYEQCPYTGIEMMAHGLPVVASDSFGLRNMFREGVNARIARIGNRENPNEFVQHIADAILEMLASKELCEELGAGAESIYQSTYHARHMKENYKRLLDSL